MTIEINESDESILLEIFKRFKVKIKEKYLPTEQQIIRDNLRQKYVTTGEWDSMSLEDREDAVLNEQIIFYGSTPKVDMDEVITYLKNKSLNHDCKCKRKIGVTRLQSS